MDKSWRGSLESIDGAYIFGMVWHPSLACDNKRDLLLGIDEADLGRLSGDSLRILKLGEFEA